MSKLAARALAAVVFPVALLFAAVANAQLSIEITGAGAQRIPIAIVPFAGEGAVARALCPSGGADLDRR